MKVQVEIYNSLKEFDNGYEPMHCYIMDHDDPAQRKVLGKQCRNALEAGPVVLTFRKEE